MNKIVNKRKGVTPVIAIVLLLTVTIGAVGILYTQVGDLLEQDDGFDDIDRVQDTEINIRTGVEGDDEDGEDIERLYLSIYNSGERALPFEQDFHVEINGVDYETFDAVGDLDFDREQLEASDADEEYSAGCLGPNMELDIDDSTDSISEDLGGLGEARGEENVHDDGIGVCNTGIEFPSAFDDPVEVRFLLEGSSRTWSFECNPDSDQDGFC